jgi:hypothetical protein
VRASQPSGPSPGGTFFPWPRAKTQFPQSTGLPVFAPAWITVRRADPCRSPAQLPVTPFTARLHPKAEILSKPSVLCIVDIAARPLRFSVIESRHTGRKEADVFKETDRSALLWGTIIGVAMVAAMMVGAFYFPNLHVPLTDVEAESSMVTVLLYVGLIASYRKLWNRAGFWMLLLIFLAANTAFYWLVFPKFVIGVSGLQMSLMYGLTGGLEILLFALAVLRVYHRGPKPPKWLGMPR